MIRAMARLFGMSDAVWRRHANPWSGYSRAVTGLPLVALAIWSRVWLGWGALGVLALVVLWLWLNPRLFPAPALFDAWISRAVLGERLYLRFPDEIGQGHRRAAAVLAASSLPGMLAFAWGLYVLRLDWVILGGALGVVPKLWFLDRMVWIVSDWEARGRSVWEGMNG